MARAKINLVTDGDFRALIRDITRRNELVWREVMAELRELRQASREHTGEIRELSLEIREMREEGRRMRKDARDEARAQREALFRLIDKINQLGQGPDPGPASA